MAERMQCWRRGAQIAIAGSMIALGAAGSGCSFESGTGFTAGDPAPDAGSGGDDEVVNGTPITIRTSPFASLLDDGPTEDALLVAFRDGGGPWRTLRGHGGIYKAGTVTGRYAVVTACLDGAADAPQRSVHVFYQSIADTTEIRAAGCSPRTPLNSVKITVDVLGVPPGSLLNAAAGPAQTRGNTTHAEFSVPRGVPAQVFAASIDDRSERSGRIARGPTVAATSDQAVSFDLNAVGAVPDTAPIMLAPPGAPGGWVVSYYSTPALPTAWYLGGEQNVGTYHYLALPAAQRQLGDVSDVELIANDPDPQGIVVLRTDRQAIPAGSGMNAELPVPWLPPSPTIDSANHRAAITLPITPSQLGTVDYEVTLFTAAAVTGVHRLTLHIGSGWLPQRSDALVTTPDLSELPGWTPSLDFPFGPLVQWSIIRLDHNGPLRLAPALGRRVRRNVFGFVPPF